MKKAIVIKVNSRNDIRPRWEAASICRTYIKSDIAVKYIFFTYSEKPGAGDVIKNDAQTIFESIMLKDMKFIQVKEESLEQTINDLGYDIYLYIGENPELVPLNKKYRKEKETSKSVYIHMNSTTCEGCGKVITHSASEITRESYLEIISSINESEDNCITNYDSNIIEQNTLIKSCRFC